MKNINFKDGLGLDLEMPKTSELVPETSKEAMTSSKSMSVLGAKPGLGINLAGNDAGLGGKPILGLKGLGGGGIDLQKLIK